MAEVSKIRLNGVLYDIADDTARATANRNATSISALSASVAGKQDQITFDEDDFQYNEETGALSLSPNAGITVDTMFNQLSANPVQNRVITAWKEVVETVLAEKWDSELATAITLGGVAYTDTRTLLEALAQATTAGPAIEYGTSLPNASDYEQGDLFGLVEEVTDMSGTLPVTRHYVTLYLCKMSSTVGNHQWFKSASGKVQDELVAHVNKIEDVMTAAEMSALIEF